MPSFPKIWSNTSCREITQIAHRYSGHIEDILFPGTSWQYLGIVNENLNPQKVPKTFMGYRKEDIIARYKINFHI